MTIQRIDDTAGDGICRRLVKDDFHALDGLADDFGVRHIAIDDLDLVLDMTQFGSVARGPIIENANFMAYCQQGIHQMRTDETASSSN
jgi:hypothetical protein